MIVSLKKTKHLNTFAGCLVVEIKTNVLSAAKSHLRLCAQKTGDKQSPVSGCSGRWLGAFLSTLHTNCVGEFEWEVISHHRASKGFNCGLWCFGLLEQRVVNSWRLCFFFFVWAVCLFVEDLLHLEPIIFPCSLLQTFSGRKSPTTCSVCNAYATNLHD